MKKVSENIHLVLSEQSRIGDEIMWKAEIHEFQLEELADFSSRNVCGITTQIIYREFSYLKKNVLLEVFWLILKTTADLKLKQKS